MTPLQKIQAARYALVAQRPYLATALMRIRLVGSTQCPHPLAASEGWAVYYNPDLVAQAQVVDLVVSLRREVERLIRRHARRLRAYPRDIAEVASTLEVDDDLAAEYGEREDWTLPQALGFEMGRMAEEYAVRLMDVLADEGTPKSAQQQQEQSGDESDSGAGAGAGQQGDASSQACASSGAADDSSGAADDSSGGPSACSQATDASSGSSAPASASGGHASDGCAGDSSGGDRAGDSSGGDRAGDATPSQGDATHEPRAPAPAPESGSAATGRPAPWETDEEPVSEVEVDRLVEETIQRAREWHKSRGAAPANLLRRYGEVVKTVPVPWQRLLARAINDARAYTSGAHDYSYRRPSRRQHAVRDVILPAMQRPLLEIVVVVDTSDSIGDDELGLALREVQAILKRGGVANLRVCFANTRIVHEAQVRTPAEAVRIFRQMRGGGGTDMGAAVREAMLKRPRPHAVVVVTDGVTPWGDAPQCRVPVIAVITPRGRKGQAPDWVREIDMEGLP